MRISDWSSDVCSSDLSPRIKISSPKLDGSLALRGARFDDLSLREYRQTVDETSPEVTLFSPTHTDEPYFSEFGFIGAPRTEGRRVGNESGGNGRSGGTP